MGDEFRVVGHGVYVEEVGNYRVNCEDLFMGPSHR